VQGIFGMYYAYWLEEATKLEDVLEMEGFFFHCPLIFSIFIRKKFQAITSCLHITNPAHYVHDRGAPGYDKMDQVWWLANAICDAFKKEWKLGKYIIANKMAIGYKGLYCPTMQYMPKKPHNGR
jgi:hypothetical protein